MIEIIRTDAFARWFSGLRDQQAIARIRVRIDRLSHGNFGDLKSIGKGVDELRVDYGPGYRVYLTRRGDTLVILLAGGDKRRQQRDIRLAQELAAQFKEKKS